MCDKIIEAKGTIVLDENLRTGRRARKMHGEGDRKTKPRKRDRKSTHLLELPLHPVLKGAYAILMGLEGGGGCWWVCGPRLCPASPAGAPRLKP